MTIKTRDTLNTEITAIITDNNKGDIDALELRQLLLDLSDSAQNKLSDATSNNVYKNVFIASDTTGTTDVLPELAAALVEANGETLYIPDGTYLLHSTSTGIAPNISNHVVAHPQAVFLNDYRTDDQARAIWQRNESGAGSSTPILQIDNIVWFRTEQTTRIRVANASSFAAGDIIHVHSQNGILNSALVEGGEIRRIGQAATIAEVDYKNNYIYTYGALEYTPFLLTNPVLRKYGAARFYWEGGKFVSKSKAAALNPENNDQGFRRPCIEISGTPYVHLKNITFDTNYAQSIQLTSCPYSIVEQCRFVGSPNLRLPSESAPVLTVTNINRPSVVTQTGGTTTGSRTITMANTTGMIVGMEVSGSGLLANTFITDVVTNISITIADPCTATGSVTITGYPAMIITTNAVTGLADSNFIMFSGVGGMTQLNGRFYTLDGAPSGNTFTLQDYFGRAALNSSGTVIYQKVSGRIFDAWTSGGIVRETSGGDTALTYGVQLYGACDFSVVRNCYFQNMRHAVTSDGRAGNTYSDSQWFNYGQPCRYTVNGCVAIDAHGIPFDTHEEGINIQFIDCHSINTNRGPYFQSSYAGTGFQDRATNTLFQNCSAIGGTQGFRISKSDNILTSITRIVACSVTNNRTAEDESGIGLFIAPEVASGTRPTKIVINGFTATGCGTGIETRSAGSATQTGTALDITASGLMFYGSKVGVDVGAGVHFKCMDTLGFDVTGSEYSGEHYVTRNRSQANATLTGGSKTAGSAVITGLTGATSYFPGMFVSGSGVPSLARILSVDSATQITLDVPCFLTETSDIVIWRNSSCLLLGGVSIVQDHRKNVTAVFGESDTNSTKYTYIPPDGVLLASSGIKMRTFSNANIAAEIITVPSHTFRDMEAVRVKLVTGVMPTNVAENTTYFVNNITSTTISLHTTMAGALANTGRVAAASAGAGTYTIQAIPNMQWRTSSIAPTTIGTYPEIFRYS